MSPEQIAFIRLHQGSDWVEETRHLFQGAMIRAKTKLGKTATLARDAVQTLVDMKLIEPSYGGSFRVTDEGKRI